MSLILALAGLWHVGAAASISAKAWLGQVLLEAAWARSLDGEDRPRPWPWADAWPVARLQAPAEGVDLIVLSNASGRSLAWGPGLVSGSAAPDRPGLTLLGGHRDTHFRFLADLVPGESLVLQTPDGRAHDYRVTDARVVDTRSAVVRSAGGGSSLALVTCYPFDAVTTGGPLRYVVHAAPVLP